LSRHACFFSFVVFCIISIFAPAHAAGPEPSSPSYAEKDAANDTTSSKTEIITDEKNGVVRILIGGKEVVIIDDKGLHVKGDVNYSGVMTDTGGGDAP